MEEQEIENRELPVLEAEDEKRSSWGSKIWFLVIVLIIGGLALYQFSPNFLSRSREEKSSSQDQSEEKNKAGLLDIFSKSPKKGELAPDLVSEDVYGNKISLGDFRDRKPVLLVFWATWCGYCSKELPDLKAFTQKYQNKIQVIAVSSGESKETIRKYIQEKDINFLILLDKDRKIWKQYLVRGTPAHFLISSQGKLIASRPGLASKTDLETMVTMLTELW